MLSTKVFLIFTLICFGLNFFLGCGKKDEPISSVNTGSNFGWTKLLGVSGFQTSGNSLTKDSNNNIYLTGSTFGNLDNQILTGNRDVLLTKFNSNGAKQWTKLIGAIGAISYGTGVQTDSSGNIYLSGTTYGNLDSETITGLNDAFVIKYDSNGTKKWIKLIGVAGKSTYCEASSIDSSGNLYITGHTYGNLDGQSLTGTIDSFLVKYDSSGNKQWTKLLGESGTTTAGSAITVDSYGDVYVVGGTTGNLDGQILMGTADLFIVKYNKDGIKQWCKLLGVLGKITTGYGIVVDITGDIYTTGYTSGNLDGQILSGVNDTFIVKYNNLGLKQWTKLLGVSGANTYNHGVAIDSNGGVYVTGYTSGNLDGQILTGTNDAFVAKYNNVGVKQWTKLLGVLSKNTIAQGIIVNSSGQTFVTGYTTGNLDGQILTGTYDMFLTTKLNR